MVLVFSGFLLKIPLKCSAGFATLVITRIFEHFPSDNCFRFGSSWFSLSFILSWSSFTTGSGSIWAESLIYFSIIGKYKYWTFWLFINVLKSWIICKKKLLKRLKMSNSTMCYHFHFLGMNYLTKYIDHTTIGGSPWSSTFTIRENTIKCAKTNISL